ncbi:Endonuclease-reverse transcriptase [Popillia japonica]|uniref:Endonuclease-reverse transcriptase n=1 Tax=Popillia japonica TaxID=7064 RepID=A0AAW1IGX2_POPJA
MQRVASVLQQNPPMQERLDGNNYKSRGNNIEIIPMMQSRRCGLVERMVTEGVRKSVPVGDLVGVVSAVSGVSDDRNIPNDGPADGTDALLLNIQALTYVKTSQLECELKKSSIKFLCLNEVWTNSHNYNSFHIDNFRLVPSNSLLIFTGDFNVHFENMDSRCMQLIDIMSTYNMCNSVGQPTRVGAMLDAVFTNLPNVQTEVIPCVMSDHCNVFVQTGVGPSHGDHDGGGARCMKYMRSYNKLSIEKFACSLENKEWPSFSNLSNFNDAFQRFYDTFLHHFNTFV